MDTLFVGERERRSAWVIRPIATHRPTRLVKRSAYFISIPNDVHCSAIHATSP
ncbi:hypothetical protein [Burkholderia seminalis]|uniref:hypothetical protein n=1 Tax=Burkholderia seminalis TaxID=488731 RepID=UPI001907794B|nr:hypothetical protein [Burkholderia seminalis]MBJ9595601.1 hypothetical protein [Burkholderia seminalis]